MIENIHRDAMVRAYAIVATSCLEAGQTILTNYICMHVIQTQKAK